jgi:hypothetical protein
MVMFPFFNTAFLREWYQLTQRFKDKKTTQTTADGDCAFENDRVLSMEDIMTNRLRVTLGKQLDPRRSPNHGSFYLRMGAVGMQALKTLIQT